MGAPRSVVFDRSKVRDISQQMMDGHIAYQVGHDAKGNLLGKVPFTTPIKDIKALDCSGFVRYFVYHTTVSNMIMVDGSATQNLWCQKQGFESADYKNVAWKCDGYVRIAFRPPKQTPQGGTSYGHVWLISNGQTLESHGGKGPGRRSWDTPDLLSEVNACYVLGPLNDLGSENTYKDGWRPDQGFGR